MVLIGLQSLIASPSIPEWSKTCTIAPVSYDSLRMRMRSRTRFMKSLRLCKLLPTEVVTHLQHGSAQRQWWVWVFAYPRCCLEASWRTASSCPKSPCVEIDGKERRNRAVRSMPRRAREECIFTEAEPVYVGGRASVAVRPRLAHVSSYSNVETRCGWQDVVNCGCNKSQVFKMGNLEKQGLEVVPLELLRAKERLRFNAEKLGFIDVEKEGPPDLSPERDQRPAAAPSTATAAIHRRVPLTPRGPPEGSRTPTAATAVPQTPPIQHYHKHQPSSRMTASGHQLHHYQLLHNHHNTMKYHHYLNKPLKSMMVMTMMMMMMMVMMMMMMLVVMMMMMMLLLMLNREQAIHQQAVHQQVVRQASRPQHQQQVKHNHHTAGPTGPDHHHMQQQHHKRQTHQQAATHLSAGRNLWMMPMSCGKLRWRIRRPRHQTCDTSRTFFITTAPSLDLVWQWR